MRKHMNKNEEETILGEIIPLYKCGYAPNLVAAIIEKRLDFVERLIFRYLEKNKSEITTSTKFFVKKSRKIAEIFPQKIISDCFVAESEETGKIILGFVGIEFLEI